MFQFSLPDVPCAALWSKYLNFDVISRLVDGNTAPLSSVTYQYLATIEAVDMRKSATGLN